MSFTFPIGTRLRDRITRSQLLKQVLTLFGGAALGQLILFASTPLLARWYTEADFGLTGTILTLGGFAATVAGGQYEAALVLEKDDAEADRLQCLVWRLMLLLSGAFTLLTLLLVALGCLPGEYKKAGWILPFSGLYVLSTAAFQLVNMRLSREQAFGIIARGNVLNRSFTLATQLGGGLFHASTWGLVGGYLAGQLAFVWKGMRSLNLDLKWGAYRWRDLSMVARKYRRFPMYSAPQNLLNAVSQGLPVYLLGIYYGNLAVVGAYWMAVRVLQLPVTLVSQSIRQVYYRQASDHAHDPQALLQQFLRVTGILMVVGLTVIVGGFILLPHLFTWMLGEPWAEAGIYARWMVLWIGALLVNPPAIMLFNILKLNGYMLIFDITLLVLRILALLLPAFLLNTPRTSIIAFSCVGLFMNTLIILAMFLLLRYRVRHAPQVSPTPGEEV